MQDCDVLARTLYGEARGEYERIDGGVASLLAVAHVIKNRASKGGWFGRSIQDVCLKPKQFSCWNSGDPNREILMNVSAGDEVFSQCLLVAEKTLMNAWPDITKGSDHYHATYVMPFWAVGKKPCFSIGRHLFYRLSTV